MEMNRRPDVVTRIIGSKEGYTNFIMELRQKLPPPQDLVSVDDILGESPGAYPVLRRQSARASRWLWVELQAVVAQQMFTTTLAVRDDYVYCKGFRNQRGVWYELSGDPIQNCPMLPSSGEWGNVEQLPGWDVSYSSILQVDNREQVEDLLSEGLGRAFAEMAVRRLAQYPDVDSRDDYLTRLALAGLIVMVCESARFNAVLDTFVGGWDRGTGLTRRLAGYMWEWKDMSHGLLQWRTNGFCHPFFTSRLIRSAGHALAHIHLVLNYSDSHQSKNPKYAQGCYNLHGKNSRSNNPEQDKGSPPSGSSRGPSGSSRQHSTNKQSVLSKQASESPKDDNALDDPSEPREDDRQIQSPEETLPGDDNAPDAGHPREDDSSQAPGQHPEDDNAHQGPDQPGEDDSSQQGPDKFSERYGQPRVEIFAVRANFHATDMTISVFDGIRGQIIYMPKDQGEQPEVMDDEEMNNLVLTGPYRGIPAYGNFAIQVDMPSSATGGGKKEASPSSSGDADGPITWEWDRYNPEHAAQVDAPEPVTHAISLDSWRKIHVTYLVMSNAVEAKVKVNLPEARQDYLPHEKDYGETDDEGGSKYTARGTITAHISGFEKHPILLFTSAVEVPVPSKSLTLPLARATVQVPQGKRLHIDMADLQITEYSSNREVKKSADSDSLSFDFGHVSPAPQFNNDTEEVEVNVTWQPQQNKEKIQVKPHQVCIIGDKEEFSAFIGNQRRVLADHPERKDALEDYRGRGLASTGEHPVSLVRGKGLAITGEHPVLTRPCAKQPKRWIHIKLQVVAGWETLSTTLAVRDDKCYGVGFMSQRGVWYDLGNRRGDRALPPEYNSVLLDWGVSYKDILHVSSWDEVVEELDSARPGKDFAEKAVRTLSRYPYVQEGDNTRLAVAGLFIMVCESAKFNPLLKHFVDGWDNGTGFPHQLMNYIRNWGHVSRALLRWKDLGYDSDTFRHYLGQQPVGISDPENALDVVHLVFNSREALSYKMGTQEGLPPSGVLREVDLTKIALKDHVQAWITKGMMKSAVAPQQPLGALCYHGARNTSFWVVHKALASLEDNMLKHWAATFNLGPRVEALEQELKSVKVILELTLGKVIHKVELEGMLVELRELVYQAEDVLDEMEYFRIQGTILDPHVLDDEPPNLRFNRDNTSRRIKYIVNQMQPKRQEICNTIKLLGPDWSTVPNIAQSRPVTTSHIIDQKLYGRNPIMNSIIHDITKDKDSAEVLTVIPIVGPGGIGKTTLAQHIYHSEKVKKHFDVRVWTCVSFNFNVNKLTEEIQRYIPEVDGEHSNDTASELIGKRLKNKRLLLVLDDIWDCSNEDEWKRLLVPFKKSQVPGNIIIVTTRFPAQAQIMVPKYNQSIHLEGIENKEFEELFLEIVFGDDDQSRKEHVFLLETGFKIVDKLKGSPLAAKTAGRLLKTKLDLDHWKRVQESKDWEHSDGMDDIMPALKLSFDYLPSQLQQCFSYCALFPQDHKFDREELINFWIGLEVLHSSHGENKRVEDIGLSHLTELVNYGFLESKAGEDGRTCYIIHDLLHELARKVSSLECLSIDSSQSQVSSLEVLPSICHLSINIVGTSVKDRLTLKNCVEDFNKLHTRLEVEKLQSLMIFGELHGCFVEFFGDLLRKAKALRLVSLSRAPYDVKDLLHNFYGLIHLRYLRIESGSLSGTRFLDIISRFYHMKVLDLKHFYIFQNSLPENISKLQKLRYLHVQDDTIHSGITEVGKLKSLQELRRFVVKQHDRGFELRQIGHLEDLCGSLCIDCLENVQSAEEASKAKLMLKNRLHELILRWNIHWSTNDSALEEHVLERLKPSSNLQKLSIIGHRGGTCPSWLGMNLSLSSLKSLCLDEVNWKTFPPIGDLWLVNVPREEISINIPEKRFGNLRWLELVHLSGLQKWAVHAPCQLLPYLEVLNIKDCPQLVELSLQHFGCCQQGKEVNVNLFPRLKKLYMANCPQLSSFPPVPWNEAHYFINVEGTGISCLGKLVCDEEENSCEYRLTIEGKEDIYTTDSTFWNVLDFHNLTGLKVLRLRTCQPLPLYYLQMLSSLRTLEMSCSSNVFPFVEADSHVKYKFPVELLEIKEWNASGKELTQLLTYFTELSDLRLWECNKVTGLGVNVSGQRTTQTPGPSSSSADQVGPSVEEEEIVASEEAESGLLLLPSQLQELEICECPQLSLLRSSPQNDSNKDGLQALTSLRRLQIQDCPELLSSCSSSSFLSFPFPNSLEHLDIGGKMGMDMLVPLSNLTSLTSLDLFGCEDLRGEGWLSLLARGYLTRLSIIGTPNFFVDSDPSQVHEKEIPSCSSKLQKLRIDDMAGFTAEPIHHNLLFSSLTELEFFGDNKVERFTEEQEALLFINSLEHITFQYCHNLQSLPERLHRLPNLKRLQIWSCEAIQMLPKDGLPSSLQELVIRSCPEIQSLPKDCLPDSLQKLEIRHCPAIQSLPKVDDLPTSLRELDVRFSESEELRSQCHRLINIIPIVRLD